MTTETLTGQQKAVKVREHEAYTMGTEHYYRHNLNPRLIYTDGIKFLVETCGAYWLIDVVASHQSMIRRAYPRECAFQVWLIYIDPIAERFGGGSGCIVEAWSDSPRERGSLKLVSQGIPYTDFPAELMPYEFWVEESGDGLVMMMKRER